MAKIIALTTGMADQNKLSGNVGFRFWFWEEFRQYAEEVDLDFDPNLTPLHVVLPTATVGDWQDNLLTQLEGIQCSLLHLEFQPINHLQEHNSYFYENAVRYRKKVIESLRGHLDRSNWGSLIITGLAQDECQVILDLHLHLDMEIAYPVTDTNSVSTEVKTIFKRATNQQGTQMNVCIARNINGITINPHEYILDENGDIRFFTDEEAAKNFLLEHGFNDEQISWMHFKQKKDVLGVES
jgi:hypothetical protein